MKKIKIKAKIKPKCDCENHYLELCTSFDGETYQYQRYCYKCHKTWNYTKSLVEKCSNACDSYITDGGANRSYIYDTYGGSIAVPRMEVMKGAVMFDNGCNFCYVYKLNKDGTCGDLIRFVEY